jgi:serine/threonine protein phosphatase PrpC
MQTSFKLKDSWEKCFEAIEKLNETNIQPFGEKIKVTLPPFTLRGVTYTTIVRELDLAYGTDIQQIREKMIELMKKSFSEFSAPVKCKSEERYFYLNNTLQLQTGPFLLSNHQNCNQRSNSESAISAPKHLALKKQPSLLQSLSHHFPIKTKASKKNSNNNNNNVNRNEVTQLIVSDAPRYTDQLNGAQRAWREFDMRVEGLIVSFPSIPVKAKFSKFSSTSFPSKMDLNNNGWYVNTADLTYKEVAGVSKQIQIERGKEKIALYEVEKIHGIPIDSEKGNRAYYNKVDQRLYATKEDAIYHDAVLATGGCGKPVIITICDGCGKGAGSALVASKAVETGHQNTHGKIKTCSYTHDVFRLLFSSLKMAQNTVIELDSERDTTYLQIAILESFLLGVTGGDCKAFIFRKSAYAEAWICIDLTPDSRDSTDLTNPGGFIKASKYLPPDLIGMKAFYFNLEPEDILYVCTDGVTDNFDPRVLLKKPSELNIPSKDDCWEHIDRKSPENIQKIEDFIRKGMEKLVTGCHNEEEIYNRIAIHIQTMQSQRMLPYLTNIHAREWELFPSKSDDAANVSFTYKPQNANF